MKFIEAYDCLEQSRAGGKNFAKKFTFEKIFEECHCASVQKIERIFAKFEKFQSKIKVYMGHNYLLIFCWHQFANSAGMTPQQLIAAGFGCSEAHTTADAVPASLEILDNAQGV